MQLLGTSLCTNRVSAMWKHPSKPRAGGEAGTVFEKSCEVTTCRRLQLLAVRSAIHGCHPQPLTQGFGDGRYHLWRSGDVLRLFRARFAAKWRSLRRAVTRTSELLSLRKTSQRDTLSAQLGDRCAASGQLAQDQLRIGSYPVPPEAHA